MSRLLYDAPIFLTSSIPNHEMNFFLRVYGDSTHTGCINGILVSKVSLFESMTYHNVSVLEISYQEI